MRERESAGTQTSFRLLYFSAVKMRDLTPPDDGTAVPPLPVQTERGHHSSPPGVIPAQAGTQTSFQQIRYRMCRGGLSAVASRGAPLPSLADAEPREDLVQHIFNVDAAGDAAECGAGAAQILRPQLHVIR